jgi:hypothetical protein
MQELPPFYTLQIGVCFCRCDIRINDIPLLVEDASGGRIDVELPLNPNIYTGDNTLSFRLFPETSDDNGPTVDLDNPNVYCSVEIVRRPYAQEIFDRTVIASIVYRGGAVDNLVESSVEAPGISAIQHGSTPNERAFARVVSLTTPLPEWRWVRAPVIEAGAESIRDVLQETRRLWAMLRDRDVPGLRTMLATNAREIQAAYFQPSLEDAWRMLGIEEMFRNPEAKLGAMSDNLKLEIFANGRIARLTDSFGDSPLWFHEGDSGLNAYINAMFCRGASGEWIKIR